MSGLLFTDIRLVDGYRPRKKPVKGEKARNGRAFLDASVGVVEPLAGGVFPSKPAVSEALGVVELGSTGEFGREDDLMSEASDNGESSG